MNMKKLLVASLLILPALNQQAAQAGSEYIKGAKNTIQTCTQRLDLTDMSNALAVVGFFAENIAPILVQSQIISALPTDKDIDPQDIANPETQKKAVALAKGVKEIIDNEGSIDDYVTLYGKIQNEAGIWTASAQTKNDQNPEDSYKSLIPTLEGALKTIFTLDTQPITDLNGMLKSSTKTLKEQIAQNDKYGLLLATRAEKGIKSPDGKPGSIGETEVDNQVTAIRADTANITQAEIQKLKQQRITIVGKEYELEKIVDMSSINDQMQFSAAIKQLETAIADQTEKDIATNKIAHDQATRAAILASIVGKDTSKIQQATIDSTSKINLSDTTAAKAQIYKIQGDLKYSEAEFSLLPGLHKIIVFNKDDEDAYHTISDILFKRSGTTDYSQTQRAKILAILGGASGTSDDAVAAYYAAQLTAMTKTPSLGTKLKDIKKNLTTTTTNKPITIDPAGLKPILTKIVNNSPLNQTELEKLQQITSETLGTINQPLNKEQLKAGLANIKSTRSTPREIAQQLNFDEQQVLAIVKTQVPNANENTQINVQVFASSL